MEPSGDPDPQSTPVDPDRDVALLVYTSGTTGKPKGAMLSHTNIMSVFPHNIFHDLKLDEHDRIIGILPMCHIYGAGALVYTPVALGCTSVILSRFDANESVETIAAERITLIPAVPAMYQFMLMELDGKRLDFSALRYCLCAAAPVSRQLLQMIEKQFAAKVIEGYGLSETAGGGTVNPAHATRLGSVGPHIRGLKIAIVGDDGEHLPPGAEHVGEVAIKGPSVMLGYHGKPEATQEVIKDDWLLTGDLGYMDDDGYLYIVGRKKELIIRGGQNIYPREVEEVLIKLPDVQEAAVIGVPDQYMGERVKAFVVLKKGSALNEETVKEFCSQHLAAYKVPRLVEFIDVLPRNSTGKVLKRLLS